MGPLTITTCKGSSAYAGDGAYALVNHADAHAPARIAVRRAGIATHQLYIVGNSAAWVGHPHPIGDRNPDEDRHRIERQNLSADSLTVKFALIENGPVLKRFKAGARGSAMPRRKKMSHIRIVLSDGTSNS